MRLLPLWAALCLATPSFGAQGKAQVRTTGAQAGAGSAAAPASIQSLPALSPGLSPSLGTPGAPALGAQAAPSALPSLPASAVSAQSQAAQAAGASGATQPDAPQAEAAAAPPGPPPGGGDTAAAGGGGPPRFVQSLLALGVPSELAMTLAKLSPPGSQALADKVAGALENDAMPARSKILLIAASALRGVELLDPTPLFELGDRFGFTPAQVQALAQAGEGSERALLGAFRGLELEWAQAWGPRLAQSAALLESKVKDDGKMLAAAERSASELQGREGPSVAPEDLAAAQRYIRSIMGKDKPTPKQLEGLVTLFLEEAGIAPSSPRALALKRALIPEAARVEEEALSKLSPPIRRYGGVILKVAKENGVTPAQVEAVIKKRGLAGMLAAGTEEQVERVLGTAMERERLENAVEGYPDSEQGRLMRDVVAHMMARSGKSVEEIARDGVFVYADFAGSGRPSRAWSGRDPDTKAPHMVFYFTFHDGKWKISGYRQNRQLGRSDATLIDSFLSWLGSGGVPRSDFLN